MHQNYLLNCRRTCSWQSCAWLSGACSPHSSSRRAFLVGLYIAKNPLKRQYPKCTLVQTLELILQVEYISLKGTSRDRPAVCKYTGPFSPKPKRLQQYLVQHTYAKWDFSNEKKDPFAYIVMCCNHFRDQDAKDFNAKRNTSTLLSKG